MFLTIAANTVIMMKTVMLEIVQLTTGILLAMVRVLAALLLTTLILTSGHALPQMAMS